ncbi:LacI family DNA-binding transcriptional regulator [Paenibacillus tarimensis]|uniref:LacI family DNA-binding transcriptional regulator n=1 Tax=Paenibacillus tarimensis TaxID=416012 RepID=UPI001F3B953E|nr:LacI family DNA-binding transcriptional regulator [Paenibacillus tarimensis]MCF2944899.1 LacI family transcriptional regulator [Paenibacillus tarimensis]
MATRSEVARRAGVSEATVSRVLNGVGPVREGTRKKVLEAARELDYHLNAVAASFARGRSGNLGVVLPHVPKVRLFSTYYFSEILSGIGEAVREGGYGLLLLHRHPSELYDYPSLFRSRRVDACIVLGASDLPEETAGIALAAGQGLPLCLVDHYYNELQISSVAADHRSGSREAVRHLLAGGAKRIGFLNGSPYYATSRLRLEGYADALAEAGITLDKRLLYQGNYSRKSGYELAGIIHRDRMAGRIDALFAANDRMAIGLIQGLREHEPRVQDLPLVGCDDSDAARLSDPPLTTVQVPFYDMGRLAAARLLEQLGEDGGTVFQEVLPTNLIIRQSSQPVVE